MFGTFAELADNKAHDVHHCVLDVLIIRHSQNEGNKKGPKPLVVFWINVLLNRHNLDIASGNVISQPDVVS